MTTTDTPTTNPSAPATGKPPMNGFFGAGQDHDRGAGWTLDADHPTVLVGGDNGPAPVEYVLVGLASCLMAGLANIAAARGVTLHEVTARLEGDIDLRGILGLSDEVRNGYEGIRVTFEVRADARDEVVAGLVEQARARSAVYDVLTDRIADHRALAGSAWPAGAGVRPRPLRQRHAVHPRADARRCRVAGPPRAPRARRRRGHAAGAIVRFGCTVTDLVRDADGRVVGVLGRDRAGRAELARSLASLGVHEHHLLGMRDGALDRVPVEEGTSRIAHYVARVRPDTIITFGPDGITGHVDHRAVSAWTTGAWRASGGRARLWYATLTEDFHQRWGALCEEVGVWMPGAEPPRSGESALAARLVVEGWLAERKLAALRAHASQTAPLIDAVGEATFASWWAEEAFVAAGHADGTATGTTSQVTVRAAGG